MLLAQPSIDINLEDKVGSPNPSIPARSLVTHFLTFSFILTEQANRTHSDQVGGGEGGPAETRQLKPVTSTDYSVQSLNACQNKEKAKREEALRGRAEVCDLEVLQIWVNESYEVNNK